MMKDVKLALSEAEALGVPMDVTQAVAARCSSPATRSAPTQDLTTVVQPIERRAGVEVRAQP